MTRVTDPLCETDETCTSLLRLLAASAERLRTLAAGGDWDSLAEEASRNDALFARLVETFPAATARDRQALAPLVAEVLAGNQQIAALIAPRLKDIGQLLDEMGGR